MTTSSNAPERGLDAGPIIYSLLNGHPASAICESYIRSRTGWLTTVVTLLEADAVLRKVYGVDPVLAARKLAQFAAGPIVVAAVDVALASSAMASASSLGIDLTDAVLLEACRMHGATKLCTDDERFAQACIQGGIATERPIDSAVRQQIAAWESAHLPAKGLSRVLYQIRDWIEQRDASLAQEFWNKTGAGSHLP